MNQLSHQRALVTGASSGIGKAIALAFGEAGADVLVNYHGEAEAADEVVRAIRDAGGRAVAVAADVSDPDGCARLFMEMDEAFGGLDILVANAGLQADATLTDMTLTQWRQVIDVNLTGAFLCAQHAVRRFRDQATGVVRSGATGKIIFISSVHQLIPWAGHANYAASKGGLEQLMRSLAQELAPEGVRLNAIAPGAIKTPINTEAWDTAEAKARLLKLIPYGRIGMPEDVARAAVWLASEASDYVVGATLLVDGGMSLYPGFAANG